MSYLDRDPDLLEIHQEFEEAQKPFEKPIPEVTPDYAQKMTSDQTQAADADDDF